MLVAFAGGSRRLRMFRGLWGQRQAESTIAPRAPVGRKPIALPASSCGHELTDRAYGCVTDDECLRTAHRNSGKHALSGELLARVDERPRRAVPVQCDRSVTHRPNVVRAAGADTVDPLRLQPLRVRARDNRPG